MAPTLCYLAVMPSYRTVAGEHRLEIERIKGSRFIGSVAEVEDVAAAEAFVAAVSATFSDATHNCWAWRIGERPGELRSSDDGEPRGTAGRPILAELEGRDLVRTALVVTRYFGGTKLGTGGLVRAYARAASAVIAAIGVVEVVMRRPLELGFEYRHSGAVEGVLHAWALKPRDERFAARRALVVDVALERADELRRALLDATGGEIELRDPA